jgi:hypothetical protein
MLRSLLEVSGNAAVAALRREFEHLGNNFAPLRRREMPPHDVSREHEANRIVGLDSLHSAEQVDETLHLHGGKPISAIQ